MDALIADYTSVNWYLDSSNIGFAAAVNALARKVPDCHLLLLNPDAVLVGALAGTFAALDKPGVAASAPLVTDGTAKNNRSRPWDVAHREQSLARALVSKSGYSQRIRGSRWSDLYGTQPSTVDGYLTGACLAISRDAWTAVGPFDEEFFLYGEEDDWQRRARSAGWCLRLIDEAGVIHTSHGTVANDQTAGLRSRDLLRANVALNLELDRGSVSANLYLAGTTLLDRIQRSARRNRAAVRRPKGPRPSVLLTINRLAPAETERRIIQLACELESRKYEVIIVCMRRFGPLIAEVPASIRVVRQPWWVPIVDAGTGPSIIVSGITHTETGFAALWRIAGKNRRWLSNVNTPRSADGRKKTHLLKAAVQFSDGVVASSPGHESELVAHDFGLRRRWFFAPEGIEAMTDAYESAITATLENRDD